MPRIIITSLAAWLLLCGSVAAQVTAKINGPEETDPGNLVVLDASESTGATAYKWVLIGAPSSSFAPFEGGKLCVFSRGVAGEYTFVLIVAGPDKDGKLAVGVAEKKITVRGALPTPQPNPTPGPGPSPNPPPNPSPSKITAAIYVYEKSQSAVPRSVAAAISRLNVDRSGAGFSASIVEQDVITGGGTVPKQYASAIEAAKREGLPALVIMTGEVIAKVVKNPTTEEQVMEAAK